MGDKGAGLAHTVQCHVQRPVFLWLERANFVFPVNHQPGGDGLNAACGQTPPYLLPQQRGKLIAHDPVQNTPRLLGVNQIIVDIPGVADGLLDHLLGDFVKGHTLRLPVGEVQQLFQMPRNGLALPVRVGCKVHGFRLFRIGFQFLDQGFLAPDGDIMGGKVMLQIHTHRAFRQIPEMPHAGLDNIVVS